MICFSVSFCLWSLASAWAMLAIISILETRQALLLPFKITFWGMIFPNVSILLNSTTFHLKRANDVSYNFQGVYANLTIQLGNALDSRFFRVWGLIYFCFTFIIWIIAVCRTIPGIWTGDVFQAPCLLENPTLLIRTRTVTIQETPTMVEGTVPSEPKVDVSSEKPMV